MPIVSVITPTYKRSQMLRRMIKSVLAQRFQDWELIIVDDLSPDDTDKVVAEFADQRIKYIRLDKNTGGSFIPRQKGLEASSGKYIAVLDDDDYWPDDRKLGMQVEYLENHPECELVGTDIIVVNGKGGALSYGNYPKSDLSIRKRLLIYNCFCHSAVMYRRKTIDEIGGYEIYSGGFYKNQCNEYDLWLRLGLVGKLVNLPIYGVAYYSVPRNVIVSDKLAFLKMSLDTTGKYKSRYPNWLWAMASQCAFTVLWFVRSRLHKANAE